MGVFKNEVGRPSNKVIMTRRIIVGVIVTALVLTVFAIANVGMLSNTKKLQGALTYKNSTSKCSFHIINIKPTYAEAYWNCKPGEYLKSFTVYQSNSKGNVGKKAFSKSPTTFTQASMWGINKGLISDSWYLISYKTNLGNVRNILFKTPKSGIVNKINVNHTRIQVNNITTSSAEVFYNGISCYAIKTSIYASNAKGEKIGKAVRENSINPSSYGTSKFYNLKSATHYLATVDYRCGSKGTIKQVSKHFVTKTITTTKKATTKSPSKTTKKTTAKVTTKKASTTKSANQTGKYVAGDTYWPDTKSYSVNGATVTLHKGGEFNYRGSVYSKLKKLTVGYGNDEFKSYNVNKTSYDIELNKVLSPKVLSNSERVYNITLVQSICEKVKKTVTKQGQKVTYYDAANCKDVKKTINFTIPKATSNTTTKSPSKTTKASRIITVRNTGRKYGSYYFHSDLDNWSLHVYYYKSLDTGGTVVAKYNNMKKGNKEIDISTYGKGKGYYKIFVKQKGGSSVSEIKDTSTNYLTGTYATWKKFSSDGWVYKFVQLK